MRFIGITGGIGAGKSTVLDFIAENYSAYIIKSDDLARELMEPGHVCYVRLVEAFSSDGIFDADGRMNRGRMADLVFHHPDKLELLNGIVHPAVREEVERMNRQLRAEGRYKYFILEAALLIEEHYDEVCDELWYIYASENVRRKRLKADRGYSDDKIDSIFASQLPEETFRSKCKYVIDNSGTPAESYAQIRRLMG